MESEMKLEVKVELEDTEVSWDNTNIKNVEVNTFVKVEPESTETKPFHTDAVCTTSKTFSVEKHPFNKECEIEIKVEPDLLSDEWWKTEYQGIRSVSSNSYIESETKTEVKEELENSEVNQDGKAEEIFEQSTVFNDPELSNDCLTEHDSCDTNKYEQPISHMESDDIEVNEKHQTATSCLKEGVEERPPSSSKGVVVRTDESITLYEELKAEELNFPEADTASVVAEITDKSSSVTKHIMSGIISKSASNQTTIRDINQEKIDGVTSKEVPDESIAETTETSKLSLNQLEKYYKWCILGFSSSEALSKAKESVKPPPSGSHPNCKLTFEELKQIYLLFPVKTKARQRFFIETFFGGKDLEKQFKLAFSSLNKERHPDCKRTWEELKKICAELPKESMKMKFMVETFYGGKDPDVILKTMLPHRRTTPLHTAEKSSSEQNLNSSHEKVSDDCISEPEISQLDTSMLKRYYQWSVQGFSSSEALLKAKEPVKPPTSGSHPNCEFTYEEIKQIYLLIPVKNKARKRFFIETFFGGKDLEKQFKLAFSSLNKERHPDCKRTWEELRKMCSELPKESMKMKFMVETFYEGKDPENILKTLLPNKPATFLQTAEKGDGSVSESEIPKLSLNQLKKYYKWRILGVPYKEALVKAKKPGLIPQTEDHHPDCKLPWEEIKEISLLVPAKHQRALFQVETFFGGKAPGEQLKLALVRANAKPNPGCKHSWDDLEKMSKQLPKDSSRWKFVVESFYGGKSPAELLKSMLSNVTHSTSRPTGDVHYVDGTVRKTVQFVDGTEAVDSSHAHNPTIIEDDLITKLPNGKLKLYYLWRNAGLDHENALSKASNFENCPGKRLAHPKCMLSMAELTKMVQALSFETISRDRFLIHTYFGGKDPECTMKYLMLNPRRAPQNAEANKPEGSLGKNISSLEELNLSNGLLKYYFLWRNKGCTHSKALSNIQQRIKIPGTHYPNPNCKHSEGQLRYISQALKPNKFEWDRYIVYTYYGGKDPEVTLRYFMSRLGKAGQPDAAVGSFDENVTLIDDNSRSTSEIVAAKQPEGSLGENICSIEEMNLSNGLLKYYFLWRNKGHTHSMALSNVQDRIKIVGTHYPHPNCKHSEDQLRYISQALKWNKLEWDRYIVYTYYGGKDPEVTLQYFLSRLRKAGQPDATVGTSDGNATLIDENTPRRTQENVAANQPEGSLGVNISTIEELNQSNDLLKDYFLWRNKGLTHSMALSNIQHRTQIPGRRYPHTNCKHSEDQLRHISQALKSNKFEWDRFLIYTYYGGKDPEVTLRYFLSRLGKAAQPGATVGSSDENFTLIDENTLGDNNLILYYLWRNDGCDHETALLNAKEANRNMKMKVNIFGNYRPHPNCKHTEEELRRMSQVLKDKTQWDRFFIHTYYGGKDPERTLKYLMPKCKDFPDGSTKKTMKKVSFHFEPVAKRTRSHPDSGIIPLDSPGHPSNELCDAQLKNYYSWVDQGFSCEEAMAKAKTPGLSPRQQHSRCLVPMDDLKSMSMKLPPGKLREIFITETYYAGNDPKYIMEYLLSQASSNTNIKPPSLQPQTPIQKPTTVSQQPSNQDDGTALENKPTDLEVKLAQYESTDICDPTVIEVGPMIHMNSFDLKHYYLWRNKGCNIKQVMLNVKNKVKFPGVYAPHPRCKHLGEDLKRMAKVLPTNKQQRFIVHTFYGGKDPECTINYLTTHFPLKDANNPKEISPQQQQPENRQIMGNFVPDPSVSHGLPAVPENQQIKGNFGPSPSVSHGFTTLPRPVEKQPQLQQHENQQIMGNLGPNLSVRHGLPAVPQNQQIVGNSGPNYSVSHGFPAVPPPVQWPPLGHSAVGMPTAVGPSEAVMPYQHQATGSPTMAYLPPPDAVPSMVQLYGQLAPDPASIPYSPNQYIAPPVAYLPPPASVVYSEHPRGAGGPFGCPPIHPPTISPPVPQQPPALTNSAISTKSAPPQSQNTKAGGPLVGKHDLKLSSLKRKATDELPIKINLKSTSDELKQPKQIHKETPPELDSSVPMFIVPTIYPKESLSESQMDAIESNLLEAILEMDDDGTKPSFKDTNRSNGRYGITCVDQFSVNWLHRFLDTYCPWPGASLELISANIRANAVLPPCKGDDDTKILKYIERQNKGLNVGMWTVVQRWDNGDFNTCIDLIIDEESAKVLQKSSRISFKLGTAEIVTSKKGSPPTWRLGDGNTSKMQSNPSEKPSASTSYSYPLSSTRPPKCISTGKGYPGLPESSSETDTTSCSHLCDRGRSKRAHGGSHHRNSACRSPSQDRFGRPIFKTQAAAAAAADDDDGQAHCWLDWLNWKKDTSSRSPSRNRNPSPGEYRKFLHSRSKRRRSDSRSPSPKYSRSRHRTPPHDGYIGGSPYSKKRKRVASPSPSSSSDSYSSSGQRRKDSREKLSRYY